MKKPILALPCSQRIEDLKNNRPGYQCDLCEKHIADFRDTSSEEIIRVIQETPEKVCGIFHSSQTDYKISQVFLPRLTQSVGLSLMGILGFMGPVLTGCNQESSDQTAIKLDAFRKLKFPMNLNGSLYDKKTNQPIAQASVELQQHGKTILSTVTDEHGNFTFFIQRKDLRNETFDLAFGANGYAPGTLDDFLFGEKNNGKRIRLTLQANPEQHIKLSYCDVTTAGVPMIDGIEVPPEEPPLMGKVIVEPELLPLKDRPSGMHNKHSEKQPRSTNKDTPQK